MKVLTKPLILEHYSCLYMPKLSQYTIVKLSVHVSKTSQQWTQADTKVTFHQQHPSTHQQTFFDLK